MPLLISAYVNFKGLTVTLPCDDSSDMRLIIASCCRSESGTAREPPPGVLGLVRGDDSQLKLPRLRLFGVFLSENVMEFFKHKHTTYLNNL